ncbi:hypothetical protein SLEP1_g20440 [Rubroshorea leprosula]|uniref:Uncharacterized protein n=1 Tax=Rubroshorea leprosula TaxID=152421 RepID=A0AAV5J2S8_9ROSI|nr:hypothetical protein SLEP1_g20440 [Rubroshorea leprosula]
MSGCGVSKIRWRCEQNQGTICYALLLLFGPVKEWKMSDRGVRLEGDEADGRLVNEMPTKVKQGD